MPDYKSIVYSLANDYQFSASANSLSSIIFFNGVATYSADQSSAVTPVSTAGINLTNLSGVNYGVVGSQWYFGSSSKFDSLQIYFSGNTDNTATRTTIWEYWNGSSWVTMPIASTAGGTGLIATDSSGSLIFQNTQVYNFRINPIVYNTWATTTVNGGSANFYIRVTIGTSAVTSATLVAAGCYDRIGKVGHYRFDNVLTTTDGASFTDVSQTARSGVSNTTVFTANNTNCALYMGSPDANISGFILNLTTAGAGTSPSCVYEYWNGSTWTAFTNSTMDFFTSSLVNTSGSSSLSWNLRQAASLCFIFRQPPTNWAASTINSITKFWIRIRISGAYNTTAPQFSYIYPFKNQTLSRTFYIPENSNRNIISSFARINIQNPTANLLGRYVAYGRIDSNSYIPLDIGEFGLNSVFQWTWFGGTVFSTTANDGVFTDITSTLTSAGTGDTTFTNAINANLYWIFPNDVRWTTDDIIMNIQANGTSVGGTVAWEYWNGSAWTAFTPITYGVDKNLNFNAAILATIQIPKSQLTNWTVTTVNSVTGYIFRRRITQQYSSINSWSFMMPNIPGFNTSRTNPNGRTTTSTFYVDTTNLFKTQLGSNATSGSFNLTLSFDNSGTSNTFVGDMPNISGELFLTYSADNQNQRIKTVLIPIQASSTIVTNTLASIGSNQIPQLSSYLPEASKTIRNFYIVATGNDCVNGNMPCEYGMRLDSDAVLYTPSFISSAAGQLFRTNFVKDDININIPHDIQFANSGRNQNLRNFALYAVVTYEYNAAATTTVLNSILIPFSESDSVIEQNNNTGNSYSKIIQNYFIEEPAPISGANCGCYLCFNDLGAVGPILNVREQNQANFTRLTWTKASNQISQYRYSLVLPSQNPTRGLNSVGIHVYGEDQTNNTPSGAFFGGYFIVNYYSGVSSSGIESHNRTIYQLLNNQKCTNIRSAFTNKLSTPNANYYLNGLGFAFEYHEGTSLTSGATVSRNLKFEPSTQSPLTIFGGTVSNAKTNLCDLMYEALEYFKSYPTDITPTKTYNLFTANSNFFLDFGNASSNMIGGGMAIMGVHEITYSFVGQVIGYSGNGSGLTITFFDYLTDTPLFNLTTNSGGTFSGVWYDNTKQVYAKVYDSGLGRITTSVPATIDSGSITLNFNSQRSYVWGN